MTELTMYALGIELGGEPGSVVTWYFADGDWVDRECVLCDVAIAKTQVEVQSPAPGRLRIRVPVEVAFDEHTVIGVIE